jgi:hypothetical protein
MTDDKLFELDKEGLISILSDFFRVAMPDLESDTLTLIGDNGGKLNITKDQLSKLIENMHEITFKGNYLYKDGYYEGLIHFEGPGPDLFSYPVENSDESKTVQYKLSKPSFNFILMSIFTLYNQKPSDICPPLFLEGFFNGYKVENSIGRLNLQIKLNLNKFRGFNLNLDNYFREEFSHLGIRTLKIKYPEKKVSCEDLNNLVDSYKFWFNYHYNPYVIKIFEPIKDKSPKIQIMKDFNWFNEKTSLSIISSKKYINELLHYYFRALSSDDLVLSYLSFYHIIEYFFEKTNNEIKEKIQISAPGPYEKFSDKLKKIIIPENDFTDKKLIKIVLLEYLDFEKLKEDLKFFYEGDYEYLIQNEVRFAKGDKINEEKIFETVAQRIYKVRNALVHRKEGKMPKYRLNSPDDENELANELPIIQLVAEQIIKKSADDFIVE